MALKSTRPSTLGQDVPLNLGPQAQRVVDETWYVEADRIVGDERLKKATRELIAESVAATLTKVLVLQ